MEYALVKVRLVRLRARVATLVTNFGNKLKAARIAYFKGPGHFKQTFRTSISLAKYSLVAWQARTKNCRVATRATISAILSHMFKNAILLYKRTFNLI